MPHPPETVVLARMLGRVTTDMIVSVDNRQLRIYDLVVEYHTTGRETEVLETLDEVIAELLGIHILDAELITNGLVDDHQHTLSAPAQTSSAAP